MQSLHVNFEESTRTISPIDNAAAESWETVCERFGNDVRRVMAVTDDAGYTALYACFDEDNRPVYYLVEESETLIKLRHRTFLSKLGQPPG